MREEECLDLFKFKLHGRIWECDGTEVAALGLGWLFQGNLYNGKEFSLALQQDPPLPIPPRSMT
eukprot:3939703-Rhodomonas_salina.1